MSDNQTGETPVANSILAIGAQIGALKLQQYAAAANGASMPHLDATIAALKKQQQDLAHAVSRELASTNTTTKEVTVEDAEAAAKETSKESLDLLDRISAATDSATLNSIMAEAGLLASS